MPKPSAEQMTSHLNRLVRDSPRHLQHRLLPKAPVKTVLNYANALYAMGKVLGVRGEPSEAERAASAWQWVFGNILADAVDDTLRNKVKRQMAKLAVPLESPTNPNGLRRPPDDHVFWRLARYGDLRPGPPELVAPPALPTYASVRSAVDAAVESAGGDTRVDLARRQAAGFFECSLFRSEITGRPKWFTAPAQNVLEPVLYWLNDAETDSARLLKVVDYETLDAIAVSLANGNEVERSLAGQLETSLALAGHQRYIVIAALRTAVGADLGRRRALAGSTPDEARGDAPLPDEAEMARRPADQVDHRILDTLELG